LYLDLSSGAKSPGYFNDHCRPMIFALAGEINECHPEDLYMPENVIDDDPRTVGSIDAAPVRAHKPLSWRTSALLVNGKYDNNAVYKFQIVVTNMMRIAYEFGLEVSLTLSIAHTRACLFAASAYFLVSCAAICSRLESRMTLICASSPECFGSGTAT
jgi:hypothetical protein